MDERKFLGMLQSVDKARIEGDKQLAQAINEVLLHINKNGHASVRQHQKEILSSLFQGASGYTNLIMVGGYASAFAVWQITKEFIEKEQSLIVGALLLTSIILFAGFEVFKMISQAVYFQRLNRIIGKEIPEANSVEAWKVAVDQYTAQQSRMWLFFLVPTVLTGFGAGFYLLWLFSMEMVKSV